MYGEFHVRSRVKYTYFVGFATLVLEFFLEFAPRSLSLSLTHENFQEKPKRPGEVAPVFAMLPCFN